MSLGFTIFVPLFPSRSSRIGSTWGQEEESGVSEAQAEIQVDSSQLPLVERADGEKVFRFYWLDAFEDPYSQPGKTYLHVMRLKYRHYSLCSIKTQSLCSSIRLMIFFNVLIKLFRRCGVPVWKSVD